MRAGPQRRAGARERKLGEIARRVLQRKRFYEKGKYAPLAQAWAALVGEAIAERTRVRSYSGGELTIQVDSSALLHELNNFMKSELLDALQSTDAGRDVASLRFRLRQGSAQESGEYT
ncbi:MAG: DUF721 domain-containing protein [Candidatus Brocadiaceae bacterium]|jgi:predicted nucleic acid-binding Zn ribbon protein